MGIRRSGNLVLVFPLVFFKQLAQCLFFSTRSYTSVAVRKRNRLMLLLRFGRGILFSFVQSYFRLERIGITGQNGPIKLSSYSRFPLSDLHFRF